MIIAITSIYHLSKKKTITSTYQKMILTITSYRMGELPTKSSRLGSNFGGLLQEEL